MTAEEATAFFLQSAAERIRWLEARLPADWSAQKRRSVAAVLAMATAHGAGDALASLAAEKAPRAFVLAWFAEHFPTMPVPEGRATSALLLDLLQHRTGVVELDAVLEQCDSAALAGGWSGPPRVVRGG